MPAGDEGASSAPGEHGALGRILERLARWSMRHPGLAWLLVLLPALALGAVALRAPLDLSFAGLMDREHPEIQRYFAASKSYGLGGRVPVLVEGASVERVSFTEELDDLLEADRRVRRFITWSERLALEAEPRDTELILLTLARDSFEQDLDSQAFAELRRDIEALAASEGVSVRFAGMPAVVEEDQRMTLGRMSRLTPLSLILALLLLLAAETRARALMSVGLLLVAAAVCALGSVAMQRGGLGLMESLFGVIIFGLGVDIVLHLGLRAREEADAGLDFEDAVARAFAGTGPGVVVGALTTAGAFALLSWAPEPAFARLGTSGALGVSFCLLFMLVALPATWKLAGAQVPRGLGVARARPGWLARSIEGLSRSATRRPALHLTCAGVLLVMMAGGFTQLHYESDLSRVVNRDMPALAAADRVESSYGVHAFPWVGAVDDLRAARETEAALREQDLWGRVESAASLPSGEEEREHLPDALREELFDAEGRPLVYAFSDEAHMDARRARGEREAVRQHLPEATSMMVLFEVLLAPDRPWVPTLLAGVLVFVALILAADLRSPKWVLLALLPVCVASILAFGLLGWAGVALNTVTVMAAPLVVGLGVDDGVHLVHRIKAEGIERADTAAAQVSKAIALTTATTCVAFSTLLLSGHPGLESMAWIMVLALPACLLASASTLPALVALLSRRSARSGT